MATSSWIRDHIRSNLVGYAALFVALGGTATATHLVVNGSDVVDESLRSVDLKNDEVRSGDVRNDALTGGGLAAVDLRAGAVGSSEVANGSLSSIETDPLIETTHAASIPPNKFSVRPIDLTTPAGSTRFVAPWNGDDGLSLSVQCHLFGQTTVTLEGSEATGSTLNWFYSDGSAVFAAGVALGSDEFAQFGFDGKRIEGQFIYADPNGKITVNLHATDIGSCEVHGTAIRAAD